MDVGLLVARLMLGLALAVLTLAFRRSGLVPARTSA
jgi:hypothetical protein